MKKALTGFLALVVISVAGFTGSEATAQTVVFSPSFFYQTYKDDFESEGGTTIDSEVGETFYDIKLGVLLSNNVYVGAIYSQMSRNFASSDVERTRTSYGASVGYMQPQGWYVVGHYYISSEYEFSDTLTFGGGSGFQFDFGYLFDLGSNFQIGPKISYKTFSYTELDNNGTDEDLDTGSSSDLLPMVTLAVKF